MEVKRIYQANEIFWELNDFWNGVWIVLGLIKQTENDKKRYINWICQEFEGHTKDLNKGSNELKKYFAVKLSF